MKLNPERIRAVMLEIENNWELDADENGNIAMDSISIEHLYELLPDYDKKDIFYSVYNLKQAGFLDVHIAWADGGIVYMCVVNYMTYAGHEFLNRIRDSKRWAAVKGGLSAVRDYSISAISAIAEGVANAAIATYLKEKGL